MQRILAIVCLIFCCSLTHPLIAQRTVKGTVFGNNETLIGASIVLKENSKIATTTNAEGHYTLSLPGNDTEYTLQVSYMGYTREERKLKPHQPSGRIDFHLKEDVNNLDVVVVTGTRTPKLLKDAPIITRVITASEIQKVDATHIGELLQSELPGIEFSYSMNQQVSLNMQGFGGNSVLFLIDGERIAGETLDNVDYSRLNLDNVERIEIVKGAASSLYGSNAVGGVVNIITRKVTEQWTANVNTRYGSHNERRYGANVGFNTGRFSSITNVQHTNDEGYIVVNKDDNDTTKVMGNRTWNIKENLQYTLNKQIKLTGRAGYFFRERNSQVASQDRYRDFSGGLKGVYDINEQSNLELAYSFDQYDKSTYLLQDQNDVRNYSNVQHSLRGLYSYTFNNKNILTVGGDYLRDYLMSYQFRDNGDYRQYVADAFVQFDWNPTEHFNVLTGLRYDYYSDNHINRLSPKLGLMYKVGNCSLRGSYSAGFRAPTLKEKYMVFDMANIFMIYGNPDLKSETSHNFSLSTEYTKKYYNVSLTGYYNLVDGRITTAWDQALKGQVYTNIDNIKIMGVDANASAKWPCGISTRLSYTYTHEDIEKGQPIVSQTRPHTATARIDYGKSWKNYGFNIALNGRYLSKVTADEYVSSTSYEETVSVTYPAYSIWKLSLTQKVWKGINITLAADNLFNYVPTHYYNNSPYTTGTTFTAGISLDIDRLFK